MEKQAQQDAKLHAAFAENAALKNEINILARDKVLLASELAMLDVHTSAMSEVIVETRNILGMTMDTSDYAIPAKVQEMKDIVEMQGPLAGAHAHLLSANEEMKRSSAIDRKDAMDAEAKADRLVGSRDDYWKKIMKVAEKLGIDDEQLGNGTYDEMAEMAYSLIMVCIENRSSTLRVTEESRKACERNRRVLDKRLRAMGQANPEHHRKVIAQYPSEHDDS